MFVHHSSVHYHSHCFFTYLKSYFQCSRDYQAESGPGLVQGFNIFIIITASLKHDSTRSSFSFMQSNQRAKIMKHGGKFMEESLHSGPVFCTQ